MKFDDFVNALYDAGWGSSSDAQHSRIKELWRKLWPVIADLEEENNVMDSTLMSIARYADEHIGEQMNTISRMARDML